MKLKKTVFGSVMLAMLMGFCSQVVLAESNEVSITDRLHAKNAIKMSGLADTESYPFSIGRSFDTESYPLLRKTAEQVGKNKPHRLSSDHQRGV